MVTYGNECVAKCANVLIVSEGQCPVCDIQPGDCQCGDGAYEPVCAFGLTWSDKCDADCGGYSCPQVSAFSVKWQQRELYGMQITECNLFRLTELLRCCFCRHLASVSTIPMALSTRLRQPHRQPEVSERAQLCVLTCFAL